ncbi:isoleucine--tRNA ligase [Terramyces sp. JEL0728]|nr:isoleucine--tRNA ligase [Terramyces sp. JEL0728]
MDIPESTDELILVPTNVSFPEEEHKVLAFWKEIDAFRTSVELSKGRKKFNFYDGTDRLNIGPPFATGLPHYGHLLAGTIKDVVTRYAHATGHYVERRNGWDTHGLPVEYEIDKAHNIRGPDDVAKMGIPKYNELCRSIVMTYANEWENTITRIGRWIDFKNDYKTLDPTFMESIWWVFSQLYKKDQVYRGFRIMPYSWYCSTVLSNFEAGLDYRDVTDPAVVVSFPLVSDPSVSLIAWTTTPWTLPSNLALCVHPELDYVKIKDEKTGAIFILMEARLDILYTAAELKKKDKAYAVLEKMKGAALKGLEYEPLFDFFAHRKGQSFKVVTDTYVTSDSGTGIVHQAPAFGEDDYRICTEQKIIAGEDDLPCPVDNSGNFTDEVPPYAKMNFKDADKPIQKDLKAKGRLIRQSQYTHSYPFCYRSGRPLMYKAVPAWFVRVAPIVDKLCKNNEQTYWVPENVKEKRFHNWLANARDWNISRSRYWGTPIPLWISEDFEEIVVIESIAQLHELTGDYTITDIHRDKIDHLTIPSKTGKGVLRRIPEVFDCWFESGSMPYAQKHYPFENKEEFDQSFPADFIAEGIDQTRGWFYTLMVLSTHLFDKPAWKNIIVNGLVLASDGQKMSKSKKNYPDPAIVLEEFGADSLRLFLMTSAGVRAENVRFREESVKEMVSKVMLPWFNSYRFLFGQLALLKKEHDFNFVYNPHMDMKDANVMDRWILASTQSLIQFVRKEMDAYRLYTVTPRLLTLIDTLTNWYIRLNRKRLKGENGVEDAGRALNVLFEVLYTLCRLMAPFAPFMVETMYQNLRKFLPPSTEDTRSVHFLPFPEPKDEYFNKEVERSVGRMQTVIDLGRFIRDQKTISLKTPCREMIIINPNGQFHQDVKSLESYIQEEMNVKLVTVTAEEDKYGVNYKLLPDAKALGTKFKKDARTITAALPSVSKEEIKGFNAAGKITIAGFELTSAELQVARTFESSNSNYHAHFTNEVLVILDTALDEGLIQEGHAREVVNRVQRLRKDAGLQATDDVLYHVTLTEDAGDLLKNVLSEQKEMLSKYLKQDILQGQYDKSKLIKKAEQVVNGSKFLLALVKH